MAGNHLLYFGAEQASHVSKWPNGDLSRSEGPKPDKRGRACALRRSGFAPRNRAKSLQGVGCGSKNRYPKWVALASGNWKPKTCGWPLRSFHFEPHPVHPKADGYVHNRRAEKRRMELERLTNVSTNLLWCLKGSPMFCFAASALGKIECGNQEPNF